MVTANILSLVLVLLCAEVGTFPDAHVEAETKNFDDDRNYQYQAIADGNVTSDIATEKYHAKESFLSQTSNKTLSTFCNETDVSILTPEFISCPVIVITSTNYEKFDNGSVYVPFYSMEFNESNYFMDPMCNLYICTENLGHDSGPGKFSEEYELTSNVCTGISLICIILYMLMFLFKEKMRNFFGYCLFSLSVALLGAYLCAFIQYNVKNLEGCHFNSMFMLYFFLASFFWMNTIAFDVWRSIRMATTVLRSTVNRRLGIQFVLYSLYSWGAPLMIIIAAIIVHYSTSQPEYKLIFENRYCWFAYQTPLTLYFVAPIFTLLGLNILLFVSSYYMIFKTSFIDHESQNTSELKMRLHFSLKLGSVTGLTWIFGYIAIATDVQVIWYFFTIFSNLQGVFIFISFAFNKMKKV